MNFFQKLVNKFTKNKWCLIPTKPSNELLQNMAMRYDHSFFNIISDEEVEKLRRESPLMGGQMLTSQEREGIIRTMKQLHEEVVGNGFNLL